MQGLEPKKQLQTEMTNNDVNELEFKESIAEPERDFSGLLFRSENADDDFIECGAYLYVYRVNDISLASQRFFSYFHIEFQWQATQAEYELYIKDPNSYVPISWIPDFLVLNGKFESKECKKYKVVKCGDQNSWNMQIKKLRIQNSVINLCHYEFEAEFIEKYELANFPFDCQDLKIIFRSVSSMKKVVFVPPLCLDYHAGGVSLESCQLEEYISYPPIFEFDCNDYGYDDDDDNDNDSNTPSFDAKFSKFVFRMKLKRKWRVYFWKIGVFVFVTTASSMVVYSLDPMDGMGDRYGILLTLLLTMVAFQFVVSSTLPNLPYLTYLDKYVVVSFVFLFVVIIQSALLSVLEAVVVSTDDNVNAVLETFDVISFFVFFVVFILFHIYFIVIGFQARTQELKKLTSIVGEYALTKSKTDAMSTMNAEEPNSEYLDVLFNETVVMSESIMDRLEVEQYQGIQIKK